MLSSHINISIYSSDFTCITTVTSRSFFEQLPRNNNRKIILTFDDLVLNPGDYYIGVVIGIRGQLPILNEPQAFSFRIVESSLDTNLNIPILPGSIYSKSLWKVI